MKNDLTVAIVDYGLGNLFSIKHACEHVGMDTTITSDPAELCDATAIILPGVGAFGDAMKSLAEKKLVDPLRELAAEGKPLVGICLGLQLLMSESLEFGRHEGLNIIPGSVVKLDAPREGTRILKVPQVGWNRARCPAARTEGWDNTPMAGVRDGEFMYYVHSYYVKPRDQGSILCVTGYGNIEFCSAVLQDNVMAFQFHPERSGPEGLKIYRNIAASLES